MGKIEISFVLTIVNPSEREIDNYMHSFEKINDHFKSKAFFPAEFIILSDNPELDESLEKRIKKLSKNLNNFYYYPCKENKVRLGQVFNKIDKINGKFIKTCDPDDYLDPDKTIHFIENFLPKTKGDEIIIHSYNRVFGFDIHYETIDFVEHKIFFMNNSYNPNSIYPTSIMRKIDWKKNILIWSDDLLGFLLIKNGAKLLAARNHYFYINLAHGGVSTTKLFHSNDRFYNDSIEFLKCAISEINGDNKLLAHFFALTDKPSIWFAKQISTDLSLNTSLNFFKRFFRMRKILNLCKKIDKEKKIHFLARVSLLWKAIFKTSDLHK